MRNLRTELWKNRLGLDEAIHWYPQDKDPQSKWTQGSLISRNYAEAGNLFEAAFKTACRVFGQFVPLTFDENKRGGAIWDVKFTSQGWHSQLVGHIANLKGAEVERVSTIGSLIDQLPFRERNPQFRLREGAQIVKQWFIDNGYNDLRILKPESREFEAHFVKRVHTEDWRGVADLMGTTHWRKTQLGHKVYVNFNFKVKGLLSSISVARIPIREWEIEMTHYDAEVDNQERLLGATAHQGLAPDYARDIHQLHRFQRITPTHNTNYVHRVWQTKIQPQIPEALGAKDAKSFLRTKGSADERLGWRLTNVSDVNEHISIITPELSQHLQQIIPPYGRGGV